MSTEHTLSRFGSRRLGTKLLATATVTTLAAFGALTALPAFAASGDGDDAEITRANTLNVSLTGDIDSLNPFIGTLADATNIHRIQYEPLVAWGQKDNAEYPAIAKSWKAEDGGKRWTFTLEKDAKWSDGEALDADDVAWTLNAILDNEKLGSAFGAYLSDVESVEKTGEYGITMMMKSAQAANPGTDVPIVPEHIWSKIDDPAKYDNNSDVVGSGPFVVESYSEGKGIVMNANPHYRHGAAAVKRVNWVPYKNIDAAVQAIRTGEIDMINGVTSAQYETLKKEDGIETIAAGGKGFRGLQINPGATDIDGKPMGDGNPILQDKEFRQALVRAINREELNERVLEGYGEVGTGIVPPLYPKYYVDKKNDEILSFDIDAANKQLDDAGYQRDGDGGMRTDKDGKPIKLRLYSYEHASAQETLDFLAGWFKEIGIPTEQRITSLAEYNDDTVLGTYDMYISGWTVRPNPDYLFGMNQCSSRPAQDGSGATSLANLCDPEFDKMFKEQETETNTDKREALFKKMQVRLDQDAAFPVFFYPDVFEAYRSDRFTNVEQQPTDVGSILYQNGPWGLYSATPVDEAGAQKDGAATGWIWGGVGAVVVIAIGAIIFSRRKKATAEDQE